MKTPEGNLTTDFFIINIYVFNVVVFTKPIFLSLFNNTNSFNFFVFSK